MNEPRPTVSRRYRSVLVDSQRWEHFRPRDNDVVVSTSYKGGTTWMQAICGALIFQSPDPPAALDDISPWLDMPVEPIDSLIARLDAQDHRRYVKTHLPLTALPFYENMKYIFVGRDGRDVWMSMWNHWHNMKPEVVGALNAKPDRVGPAFPLPTNSINDAFDEWLTRASFAWEKDGYPFWSHHYHAQTWWDYRRLDNVLFVHFADLLGDLDQQMRRVSAFLGIEVDESRWPQLIQSVTFDEMKSNFAQRAPGGNRGMWKDPRNFFHKGINRRWEGVLGAGQLARYATTLRELVEPALADWLTHGITKIDPKRV